MSIRIASASQTIDGRNWVYEYEYMFCDDHPNECFQTGLQMDKNISEIIKIRHASIILKKSQAIFKNKKAPFG